MLFKLFEDFSKHILLILFVITLSLELVFSWVLIPYFNSIRNITLYPLILIVILASLNNQINILNSYKNNFIFLIVLFGALIANLIAVPVFDEIFCESKKIVLSSAIFVSTFIISNLFLFPTSKSLKSWAGVILTAPVPFSGSAYSSAIIIIFLSVNINLFLELFLNY